MNLIKFITFKNDVFVAITYHKYISVTSDKDEKLVDSTMGGWVHVSWVRNHPSEIFSVGITF